jgi:hypothetical protein
MQQSGLLLSLTIPFSGPCLPAVRAEVVVLRPHSPSFHHKFAHTDVSSSATPTPTSHTTNPPDPCEELHHRQTFKTNFKSTVHHVTLGQIQSIQSKLVLTEGGGLGHDLLVRDTGLHVHLCSEFTVQIFLLLNLLPDYTYSCVPCLVTTVRFHWTQLHVSYTCCWN